MPRSNITEFGVESSARTRGNGRSPSAPTTMHASLENGDEGVVQRRQPKKHHRENIQHNEIEPDGRVNHDTFLSGSPIMGAHSSLHSPPSTSRTLPLPILGSRYSPTSKKLETRRSRTSVSSIGLTTVDKKIKRVLSLLPPPNRAKESGRTLTTKPVSCRSCRKSLHS